LPRDLLESELFGHTKGAFTGATNETWGKVAAAEGGTLVLDEIGDLALETQPKLLRLLQDREYERVGEAKVRQATVRVIAASNHDLEQAVKEGRFREDLWYRLNVITLRMPPLRERRTDLLRFANGYLQFFARQCGKTVQGFSPDAVRALQQHSWPGNLRELRNAIERAVILAEGGAVQVHDLPESLARPDAAAGSGVLSAGAEVSLETLEAEHIRLVVQRAPTLEEAARILGIDPATLYRKRKKLASPENNSGPPAAEPTTS
jgi:NtrC-family two-component system response regulator AlgB